MNSKDGSPARLGFAVKILGNPDLKSNDSRRWQSRPSLKVSLQYLEAIFKYLAAHRIRMYRMSSDLAPYATHPDMPQFHGMIREARGELEAIGRAARDLDIRLSFHPSQFIVLNSPDQGLVNKSIWDIESQAEMLDLMGLDQEAVVVTHVGGVYGDRTSGRERWARTWERLSDCVRRRLVLENDDQRFSAADALWIHDRTGVRLVFDYQHFWCFNPEGLELVSTARRILATWPAGARPKIHFSSPRTELRPTTPTTKGRDKRASYLKPQWTNHADYVNPFEFITFIRRLPDVDFDVMLESKGKDISLLQLRADLVRFAPDLASRFGAGWGE